MNRFEKTHSKKLYRSRNGIVFGVCRGVAEYFDFSVFWIRFFVLIFFLMSGFWAVAGLYFIVALIIKPDPVVPISNTDDQEFYDSYTRSRTGAIHRLKKKYQTIERRLIRLEHSVTSREFEWDD